MTDTNTNTRQQQLTQDGISLLSNTIDNNTSIDKQPILQIVNIYRYNIDLISNNNSNDYSQSTGSIYNIRDCSDNVSCYDIVVTDGITLRKCVVSSNLIKCIELGQFNIYDIIRIKQCNIRYTERRLIDIGHIVLYDLEVITHENVLVKPLDTLTWSLQSSEREIALTPLICNKLFYLSLYNDDTLYYDYTYITNHSSNIDTHQNDAKQIEQTNIHDITQYNSNNTVALYDIINDNIKINQKNCINNIIICRIVSISRILYFGKHKTNYISYSNIDNTQHTHPYLYEMLVSDTSIDTAIKVSIWNNLVLKYYNILNVGDVISIINYKIKQKDNNIEISCNPYNPYTVIHKIDNIQQLDTTIINRLSYDIQCNFVNINTLLRCPDNWYFDIIGTIIHIGNRQRELTYKNEWREYRWLLLCDNSTKQYSVAIKQYTNSQADILYNLNVGQCIIVTNLHIFTHNNVTTSIVQQRSFHLVCSTVSRIYVIDNIETIDNLPSKNDTISQYYNWHAENVHNITTLQSIPSAYYWFNTLDSYTIAFTDSITALNKVNNLIDNISIYQVKNLLLTGYIRSIVFTLPPDNEAITTTTQQSPVVTTTQQQQSPAQTVSMTQPTPKLLKRSKRIRGEPPTPFISQQTKQQQQQQQITSSPSRLRQSVGNILSSIPIIGSFISSPIQTTTEQPVSNEESQTIDSESNIHNISYGIENSNEVVATITLQSLNQDTTIDIDILLCSNPHTTYNHISNDIINNNNISQLLLAFYRILPDNITSSDVFKSLIQYSINATTQQQVSSTSTSTRQIKRIKQADDTTILTQQQIQSTLTTQLLNRRVAIPTYIYRQSYDNVQTVATNIFTRD